MANCPYCKKKMTIPTWTFCDDKECRQKRSKKNSKKYKPRKKVRKKIMRLRIYTCVGCGETKEEVCGNGKKLCSKCFREKYGPRYD